MQARYVAIFAVALAAGWWLWPMPENETSSASEPQSVPAVEAREPASTKQSKAPEAQASAPTAAITQKLEAIHACYERDDCNYPRTDARSYEFAVGQDLKRQLLELTAVVRREQNRDPSLSALARFHLQNEDGHVQAAALALLATQEISRESLEAILAQVIGGYDAQLIQQALAELSRYQSDDDRVKITTALADAMVTGSPFVAQEISRSIEPFVYARSVPDFEAASVQLPEGSLVRTQLMNALAAFRRRG